MRGICRAEIQLMVVEHGRDYNPCLVHVIGTEQYPQYVDKEECDEHSEPGRHGIPLLFPYTVNHHADSMTDAPYNECPARAVPYTADQEHNPDIEIYAYFFSAASTKRDVDILGQESIERYMLSAPEILKISGPVRGVKVQWKIDVEHFSDTDSHVAIAAEIKIQLERIA